MRFKIAFIFIICFASNLHSSKPKHAASSTPATGAETLFIAQNNQIGDTELKVCKEMVSQRIPFAHTDHETFLKNHLINPYLAGRSLHWALDSSIIALRALNTIEQQQKEIARLKEQIKQRENAQNESSK